MAGRRKGIHAEKGQMYAVEWIEWVAHCANAKCHQMAVLVEMGTAETLAEAEKSIRDEGSYESKWVCRKGRWYCPDHAPKPSRTT